MAHFVKRLPSNVEGNFFVDSTCIDCDTCRQLAPSTFVERGDYSSVYRQPANEEELREAYRALLACPVGSIGTVHNNKGCLHRALASFPLCLEENVYYNGFTSKKSFGAASYFVQHPEGNWLIDSPRYVPHLVEAFRHMGGIRYIFLSHEDDVADAARYAGQFNATRIIHADDAEAMPGAERTITGYEPVQAAPQFALIPVPGHTSGSMALLYADRYLFTGDHLSWDRDSNSLRLPSIYVWNEDDLLRSTTRLLNYHFEWVLPGHGDRIRLPAAEMKRHLHRLIQNRQAADT